MLAKTDLVSGLQNIYVHFLATLYCLTTSPLTSSSMRQSPYSWLSIGPPLSILSQTTLPSTLTPPIPSTYSTHSKHLSHTIQIKHRIDLCVFFIEVQQNVITDALSHCTFDIIRKLAPGTSI